MLKIFPTAIAAILLAIPAWAQDPAEDRSQDVPPEEQPQSPSAQTEQQTQGETGTATPPAENEAGSAAGEGETPLPDEDDKSILDDQTFEGEDDDFIPTEEIPVSEPIPFPTDI